MEEVKKLKLENKNLLDFNFTLQYEARDLKNKVANGENNTGGGAPKANAFIIDVSETEYSIHTCNKQLFLNSYIIVGKQILYIYNSTPSIKLRSQERRHGSAQ